MTLEEAKEILKKKGYFLKKDTERHYAQIDYFMGKEMKSAVATVNANGYKVCYSNPALHESAKEFNESLLDEQAKKIKEQKKLIDDLQYKLAGMDGNYKFAMEKLKEIESQKKGIKHLNKIIASRNKEIWDLKDDAKKLGKEVARLNKIVKGKEDLLNKYRINDHGKEELIAALRSELAEATVNKVNAQALKSAESALDYKDKYNERLRKKYWQLKSDFDELALKYDGARYNLQVQTEKANERDKELNKFAKIIEDKDKTIELIRAGQKEYVDYGVGANYFIKKICSAYIDAHERGKYNLSVLLECRKKQYGLSSKDAFEYAKEDKMRKGLHVGVDKGAEEGDKTAKFIFVGHTPVDYDDFINFFDDLKYFCEHGKCK